MHMWVIHALTGNQNRIRGGGGGPFPAKVGVKLMGIVSTTFLHFFFLNLPPSLFPLVVPVYSSDIKIQQKNKCSETGN